MACETPLDALDVALQMCCLLDRYRVRPGHWGTPGEVVSDMRGEPRRLIGELRAEHMLSLRTDEVQKMVDRDSESAAELWRMWRGQVGKQNAR